MATSETEIAATEARNRFSEMLGRVAFGKERILITRNGQRAAALLPVEDYTLFIRLLEAHRRAVAEDGQAAHHPASSRKPD